MFNENKRLEFSENLNNALKKLGVKDRERIVWLKSQLGFDISGNGVRKWLTGESMPAAARLDEIAEVCDVTVAYLLSGKVENHKNEFLNALKNLMSAAGNLPDNSERDTLLLNAAFRISGMGSKED